MGQFVMPPSGDPANEPGWVHGASSRLARLFDPLLPGLDRDQPVGWVKGRPSWFVPHPARRTKLSAADRRETLSAELDNPVRAAQLGARPIAWVRTRQAVLSGPLSEFATMDVSLMEEVRRPTSHPQDRTIQGLLAVPTEYGPMHSWFESRDERDHSLEALWRGDVRFLVGQPISLEWTIGGIQVQHVPDLLIQTCDDDRILIDVHAPSANPDTERDFMQKVHLTSGAAAQAGWEYRVVTSMPRQRAINLEYLWSRRRVAADVQEFAYQLVELVETSRSVAGLVQQTARTTPVLDAIAHLLWWRVLWTDLDAPFIMPTRVSREPQPEWLAEPWVRWPPSGVR